MDHCISTALALNVRRDYVEYFSMIGHVAAPMDELDDAPYDATRDESFALLELAATQLAELSRRPWACFGGAVQIVSVADAESSPVLVVGDRKVPIDGSKCLSSSDLSYIVSMADLDGFITKASLPSNCVHQRLASLINSHFGTATGFRVKLVAVKVRKLGGLNANVPAEVKLRVPGQLAWATLVLSTGHSGGVTVAKHTHQSEEDRFDLARECRCGRLGFVAFLDSVVSETLPVARGTRVSLEFAVLPNQELSHDFHGTPDLPKTRMSVGAVSRSTTLPKVAALLQTIDHLMLSGEPVGFTLHHSYHTLSPKWEDLVGTDALFARGLRRMAEVREASVRLLSVAVGHRVEGSDVVANTVQLMSDDELAWVNAVVNKSVPAGARRAADPLAGKDIPFVTGIFSGIVLADEVDDAESGRIEDSTIERLHLLAAIIVFPITRD